MGMRHITHWIGIRRDWKIRDNFPGDLVSLSTRELKTHALVIGATGSGKTNLLHHLISQDIDRGHSIAVLDMRGDLIDSVLALCDERVDPESALLLDLRDKAGRVGFNPLYGSGEPYFRALNVLDVISQEAESWGVQLAETLRNALLLLAESAQPLTKLEAIFYDPEFRYQCIEHCEDDMVIAFWKRFHALSTEKQQTFAMPVLNKVSLLLATPSLRKVLGHKEPVELGPHLNSPFSVTLVSLAVDELHGAGRMVGRLMLSSICREIFARVSIPENQRVPVRLYVDEFEHFGGKEFEQILAEGRRFGLSLVLAHQTLSQLSSSMRSMILNNVGVKVAFRCGRDDAKILCHDITGTKDEFDVAELPVGSALLWTRGQGACEVEVNEPIPIDASRIRNHRNEVHARFPLEEHVRIPKPASSTTPVAPANQDLKPNLEDWL
jgi:Type IV secretion-system coupling protein DNA-binding domain/TraM recognition site of TraD and TraG